MSSPWVFSSLFFKICTNKPQLMSPVHMQYSSLKKKPTGLISTVFWRAHEHAHTFTHTHTHTIAYKHMSSW